MKKQEMASASSRSRIFLAAAVAISVFIITADARKLAQTKKVSAKEHCATSSFRDLCIKMVHTGQFGNELEMAASLFEQAKQKIQAAIAEADRLKGVGGPQAKYVDQCRKDYEDAEKKIDQTIRQFSHPPTDWKSWDAFIKSLLEAVSHTYHCTSIWEDSRLTDKFLLDEVNTNLYKFMFDTYDLGTKVMVHYTPSSTSSSASSS